MSSVCQQCALRLHRASQTTTRHLTNRSFSSTRPASSALPAFAPTENQEFNGIIEDLRLKHFFPASLRPTERKVLYREKNKQLLEDNPRIVEFGGKETQYQYIDRQKDVPNRSKLLRKAVDIIADGGEKEWANLPTLLQAFYKIVQKPVDDKHIEKLIRKAVAHNNLPAFFKCLYMVDRTGLSLKNNNILEALLLAVRRRASKNDFSKPATQVALKHGSEIADLLETEQHGTAKVLALDDPRIRPQVIGLFLELAAVNAQLNGGKDDSGVVKSYAQKLLSRAKEHPDSIEVRNASSHDPAAPSNSKY
jgi:hypothetical protein